jgi:hypothetical protein
LWNKMGGHWKSSVEQWHGLGACQGGYSLIFGMPDSVCKRQQCLITSDGRMIDIDKLTSSINVEDLLYKGKLSDCSLARGGQTFNNDNSIVVSYIFTIHNHDIIAAKAILEAFRTAHEVANVEFVILDDGSSEPFTQLTYLLANIRALFNTDIKMLSRHMKPEGYILSNNAALLAARGDYAVLLNTDVQVLPGWISLMMRTMLTFPGKVGMVGPLQVKSSGEIQESGGMLFQYGLAHNMYRGLDASKLPVNHARIVDYISAACVLFNRTQFLSLGLFNPNYLPAYYEDADAAMTFLQHGFVTVLQPLAVIVHQEGSTILSQEKEILMTNNNKKFAASHNNLLSNYCPKRPRRCAKSSLFEEHTVVSSVRQPNKLLFMDSIPPEPDKDAGSIRTRAMLRILQDAGYSVSFEPAGTGRHVRYVLNLLAEGINYLLPGTTKKFAMFKGQSSFLCPWKAIIVSRRDVFKKNANYIKQICPYVPVIFDTVDLHFLREQRAYAQQVKDISKSGLSQDQMNAKLNEARSARIKELNEDGNTELNLMGRANVTFVVSTAEKAILKRMRPTVDVRIVSNIYDAPSSLPQVDPSLRSGALFVGSLVHPPNRDAIRYILRDILGNKTSFPPDFKMHIVMSKWKECRAESRDLIAEARAHSLVQVHLDVSNEELDRLHDAVVTVIAPVMYGAGVKGKINHALLRGVPVVSTSIGSEGMHLEDGKSFVLANSGTDFERAIFHLHDPAAAPLWQKLREGGLQIMQQHFSQEVAKSVMLDTLRDLGVELDQMPWRCPYTEWISCIRVKEGRRRRPGGRHSNVAPLIGNVAGDNSSMLSLGHNSRRKRKSRTNGSMGE